MKNCAAVAGLLALIAAAPVPPLRSPATLPTRLENSRVTLDRRVYTVMLKSVSLSDAIDSIRDMTGANMHVNWRALALLNITRNTPVSLQLHDVPLRKVLQMLLDDAAPGQCTFYVEDGVIEITTRQLADAQLITKVYPVQDIVMDLPNFAAPAVNLSTSAGEGGRVSGGGSSPFANNSGQETVQQQTPKTKDERSEDLVTLIKQTVQPDIWRDAGGTATIRQFNGVLIVTAPRSVHDALSTRR
jgi:hypothetical protein